MSNDIERLPLPPVRTRIRSVPGSANAQGQELNPPPMDVPRSDPDPHREGAEPAEAPASAAGNYQVGYAKPPRHSRFKPGQSGNPKGRPKGAQSLNTIVRKRMLETVPLKTARGIKQVRKVEALFIKAMEVASKGEMRAIERLFAMYASAVPEPREASDPTGPIDPALVSAADEAILAMMRAEISADLRREGDAASTDEPGENGDA